MISPVGISWIFSSIIFFFIPLASVKVILFLCVCVFLVPPQRIATPKIEQKENVRRRSSQEKLKCSYQRQQVHLKCMQDHKSLSEMKRNHMQYLSVGALTCQRNVISWHEDQQTYSSDSSLQALAQRFEVGVLPVAERRVTVRRASSHAARGCCLSGWIHGKDIVRSLTQDGCHLQDMCLLFYKCM